MPVLKFWNPQTRRYEPMSGPVGVMGDAPGARVYRSTAQSIANGTWTALIFSTAERDTHGFWNAALPTRFTIPSGMGGLYTISVFSFAYYGGTDFRFLTRLRVNGAEMIGQGQESRGWSAQPNATAEAKLTMVLNAGDYVEGWIYQANTTAAAVDVGTTTASASISMTLVREAVGQPGPQGRPGDPTASRIDIPGVKVRSAAYQSIPHGGYTKMTFTVEDWDDKGYFPGSGGDITIPAGEGGRYHFIASTYGTGWTTGRALLDVAVNGVIGSSSGAVNGVPTAGQEVTPLTAGYLNLVAGDVVSLMVYQDSGSAKNMGMDTSRKDLQTTFQLMKAEQVKGDKGDPGPAGNIPYNVGIEIGGGVTTCVEYAYTAVDLDVATVVRNDGGFTISGDTFVVPATGWYAVAANGTWSAQDDQYRVLTIEHVRSAVQTRKNITYYNVVNSLDMAITVSGIYYLLAGDRIGFQAMHGGGASGNLGFTLTSASCVSVGGPKGADGAAGPTGATGSQGPTGPAGADGAQALVIPNLVFGTAAAAGAANNTIRSDATLPLFDSTAPVVQAFSDVAAAGSVAKAARRDHRHGMPAIPPHNRAAIWSVASPMLAAYGSWQYLEPAGVIYDPMGMIAYTAPTYTIYVPETGVYLCEAYGQWEAVVEPGPQRAHGLTLGSVAENQNIVHCQPGIGMIMSSSWTRYMGAGQAVAFMQYQDARLMYYWGGWCSVVRVG